MTRHRCHCPLPKTPVCRRQSFTPGTPCAACNVSRSGRPIPITTPASKPSRMSLSPCSSLRAMCARAVLGLGCLLAMAGCTTTAAVIGAIGVATDTSVSWSIAKYMHDKWVEGGPVPCYYLNSVERALAPHCLPYQPGLMKAADLAASYKLPLCPLAMAARDPRLWPALPELIDKGAMPEACARSPLVELAQA